MKSGICGLLPAVGLGVLLAAAPLVAHHAIQAKFDDKKPMTLKGLVTKVDWLNPHVHVFMNVQDGNTVNRNFPQEGLHKKSTVAAVYDRRQSRSLLHCRRS